MPCEDGMPIPTAAKKEQTRHRPGVPLPQLQSDCKVIDVDGKMLGHLYHMIDDNVNSSIAVTCALHKCKRRTTTKKNPSEVGILRWLQAGRKPPYETHAKHNDAYFKFALPP